MYLPISFSLDLGFQVHTSMPGFVHRWGRSNSDPHDYIGILSTSYLPILLDAILLVSTSFSLFKKVIFTYEPWLPVGVCFLMVEAPELYDYLSTFFLSKQIWSMSIFGINFYHQETPVDLLWPIASTPPNILGSQVRFLYWEYSLASCVCRIFRLVLHPS